MMLMMLGMRDMLMMLMMKDDAQGEIRRPGFWESACESTVVFLLILFFALAPGTNFRNFREFPGFPGFSGNFRDFRDFPGFSGISGQSM